MFQVGANTIYIISFNNSSGLQFSKTTVTEEGGFSNNTALFTETFDAENQILRGALNDGSTSMFSDGNFIWVGVDDRTFHAFSGLDGSRVEARDIQLGQLLGANAFLNSFPVVSGGTLYGIKYGVPNLATTVDNYGDILAFSLSTGGWHQIQGGLTFPESTKTFIGDSPPNNNLGEDGQLYLDETANQVYFKSNGEWMTFGTDAAPSAQPSPYIDVIPAQALRTNLAGSYTILLHGLQDSPAMQTVTKIVVRFQGLNVHEEAWNLDTGKRSVPFTINATISTNVLNNLRGANHVEVQVLYLDSSGSRVADTAIYSLPLVDSIPSPTGFQLTEVQNQTIPNTPLSLIHI